MFYSGCHRGQQELTDLIFIYSTKLLYMCKMWYKYWGDGEEQNTIPNFRTLGIYGEQMPNGGTGQNGLGRLCGEATWFFCLFLLFCFFV